MHYYRISSCINLCVDSALALCCGLGRAVGMFAGDTLFQCLQSATFCNQYLRVTPSDTGIMSLGRQSFFLHFLHQYLHLTKVKHGTSYTNRGAIKPWVHTTFKKKSYKYHEDFSKTFAQTCGSCCFIAKFACTAIKQNKLFYTCFSLFNV